jgi:ketosteroid isomerase-like protein
MSRGDNIAAQERFAEGVISAYLDVIDELMADDVVDHDPAADQGPGPEGFKQFFTTLRNAFRNFNIEPEHVVVTEGDEAIAYTLTGTHQGTYRSLFEAGRSRMGAEEIG